MQITFGSLFAGIGGFDLGFERAGMTCKWQVEIDDYASRVLAKHWPNVHRERDIRECGKHNLQPVDVICGGFPCQDISYAGLGAGLDGERSGLFFEAIRVVRELQPRVVVLENVSALLTRGMDRVLGTLAQIGYDAEWHCIPASAVGAPHVRDRVFVIGRKRSDAMLTRCLEYHCDTEAESIRGAETSAMCLGEDVADASRQLCKRNRCGPEKTGRRKPPISDWWSAEPAVGRMAYGVPARVDRLRGLGNAVVPQVAEWIGQQVVQQLQND
jgi:DNA (cytosine-5)-methyltransferase 1